MKLLVGAAVGAGPLELKKSRSNLKEKVDLIVVDTAHGHSKKSCRNYKNDKKKRKQAKQPYVQEI